MTGVDGTEIFESSSDQARVPDACSSSPKRAPIRALTSGRPNRERTAQDYYDKSDKVNDAIHLSSPRNG